METDTVSTINSDTTQISRKIVLSTDKNRFNIFLAASISDRTRRKEALKSLWANRKSDKSEAEDSEDGGAYPASTSLEIPWQKATCEEMLATRNYSLNNMPIMEKKHGDAPFGRVATVKNAFMVLFYLWRKKNTSMPELTAFCARDYAKIHGGSLFDYVFGLDVELVMYSEQYRICSSLLQLKTSRIKAGFRKKDKYNITMKLFSGIKDFYGYDGKSQPPLRVVIQREDTADSISLGMMCGCALSAYPVISDMLYARHIEDSWYPKTGMKTSSTINALRFYDIIQTVPLGKILSCNSFDSSEEGDIIFTEIESFPQLMIANYHGISYLIRVPLSFLDKYGALETRAVGDELKEFTDSLRPTLRTNSPEILNFFKGELYEYNRFFRR